MVPVAASVGLLQRVESLEDFLSVDLSINLKNLRMGPGRLLLLQLLSKAVMEVTTRVTLMAKGPKDKV